MHYLKKTVLFIITLTLFSLGCDKGCICETKDNKVSPPHFSITLGTYYAITISSATPGAKISYTVDGTDPKTSETAVEGTSVTIDITTTIMAYAYKDDMENSNVVSYKIEPAKRVRSITYNPDFTVNSHYYFDFDCNGSKMLEVWLKDKGADGIWFNDDDSIQYYYRYSYNEQGNISKETRYTGPGEDAIWLTQDDTADNYLSYTYTDSKLSKKSYFLKDSTLEKYVTFTYDTNGMLQKESWHNSSDTLQYYYTYTYSENKMVSKTQYNSADLALTTSQFSYTGNAEYSTRFVYDETGTVSKKEHYLNFGSDTLAFYTAIEYDAQNKPVTERQYSSPSSTDIAYLYLHTYEGDNIITTEKFSDADADKLVSYQVNTYESGKLSREDTYNQDDDLQSYALLAYNENGTLSRKDTYVNPGPKTKTVEWNLSLAAGLASDGFYLVGDATYDTDGIKVGDYIDTDADDTEFLMAVISKVKAITENTSFTSSGLVINGTENGSCTITITDLDASTDVTISELSLNGVKFSDASASGNITITFTFKDFDNGGDITLNGSITKKVEGAINYTDGSITGSLNGTFKGSVAVTSKKPKWESADFSMDYYTLYAYDSSNNVVKETIYKDSGVDGIWYSADDTVDYFYDYTYADGTLIKKTRKKDYGVLETNANPDASINYYLFTYVEEK